MWGAELERDEEAPPRDLFRRATDAGLIQQSITDDRRRGRGRRLVSLTMGNAKAIDLLAERDGKVTDI